MGIEEEQLVRDFLRCTEGTTQDVEGMIALVAEDFRWQVNVPLAPVLTGRDAARAEIERQNARSTGMLEGSELRTIVSDNHTVITERVDVVEIAGKRASVRMAGVFEVRDGKIVEWREYFDGADLAGQLGVDAEVLYNAIGT